MKTKAFIKGVGLFLLAGIIAFAILELCSQIYFNRPSRVVCTSGSTDFTFPAHTFYSDWTEGFGRGTTNNEGYNNTFDYTDDMEIDVLVMGSSFMQAGNVMQNQGTAALLNDALTDETVYNIGMSGHTFLSCLANLENAIGKYSPTKYIIIDTDVASFSNAELQSVLDGSLPEMESSSGKLVDFLKSSCFLKLLYYQASDYLNGQAGGMKIFSLFGKMEVDNVVPTAAEPTKDAKAVELKTVIKDDNNYILLGSVLEKTAQKTVSVEEQNYILLDRVFEKAARTAAASGAKIIVLYHPKTWLEEGGSAWVYDEAANTSFSELCEKNGILVANMSDIFMEYYYNHKILPYGFSNSPVGTGHLNKAGHRIIVDELLEMMEDVG